MAAIDGLDERVQHLEALLAERASLRTPAPGAALHPYRGGLPLGDLDVETTQHGHTRLAPGMLDEINRRLLAIDAERIKAEAFAHGQKVALEAAQKESARLLAWLKWGLSAMIALGTGLGFMVRTLTHEHHEEHHERPPAADVAR